MRDTQAYSDVEARYQRVTDLDDPYDIDKVREWLHMNNEMAVGHLVYAALHHACEGITHADRKLVTLCTMLRSMRKEKCAVFRHQISNLALQGKQWICSNPCKTLLMIVGLGGTAFKAKTISNMMRDKAQKYITWSQSTTTAKRFGGCVLLMTIRLGISTLVPPTSPAFGIILQEATPESEKWTAMPFFLAASTLAGAVPYLLDKFLQVLCSRDFLFTMRMRWFTSAWPLTFWTGPAMLKVFESVGGGKLGASFAVIFAHAAPFMGAQTTIMQRYFLPHPLDTIISQPFGMSEDLISMAMAEATSNAVLASESLTVLIGGSNIAQFAFFSGCQDFKAFMSALLNIAIGFIVAYRILGNLAHWGFEASDRNEFATVGLQLVLQLLVLPMLLGALAAVARCLCPCGKASSKAPHFESCKEDSARKLVKHVRLEGVEVPETKPLVSERSEDGPKELADHSRATTQRSKPVSFATNPGTSRNDAAGRGPAASIQGLSGEGLSQKPPLRLSGAIMKESGSHNPFKSQMWELRHLVVADGKMSWWASESDAQKNIRLKKEIGLKGLKLRLQSDSRFDVQTAASGQRWYKFDANVQQQTFSKGQSLSSWVQALREQETGALSAPASEVGGESVAHAQEKKNTVAPATAFHEEEILNVPRRVAEAPQTTVSKMLSTEAGPESQVQASPQSALGLMSDTFGKAWILNARTGELDDVSVEEFILAAEIYRNALASFGTAVKLALSDFDQNMTPVKMAFEAGKSARRTLRCFLQEEISSGSNALQFQWLLRGLEFFLTYLSLLFNDTASAAREAYSRTLSRYHGWTVSLAFRTVLLGLPSKGKVCSLQELCPDVKEKLNLTEIICQDVDRSSELALPLVKKMIDIFIELRLWDDTKV